MLPFGEKVNVDLAHDHAIGIWIARHLFAAVPTFDLQGVRNIARAFLERGLEETVALNFLRLDNGSIGIELDGHLPRVGTKNADEDVVAQSMWTQNPKRIRV